ncbi:MAG: hypothetical protein WBC44_15775 [Planctomycetaceae bacterium]
MLILVTADLFLGSRIRGDAERSGYVVVTIPNLQRDLNAIANGERPRVVVDLANPNLDVAFLPDWLGDLQADHTLAYAPHVRVDLLKAARNAGIGTVLTRSQLDAELPRWLASPA